MTSLFFQHTLAPELIEEMDLDTLTIEKGPMWFKLLEGTFCPQKTPSKSKKWDRGFNSPPFSGIFSRPISSVVTQPLIF